MNHHFNRALVLLGILLLLPGGLGADARALYDQGRKAQLGDNLLLAVELYRSALAINPNYTEPLVGLAQTFFALEEYDEALVYLKRAQELDRSNLELWNLEGRIQLARGDPAGARDIFDRVLKQEPNNLEARFGLAELDVALGREGKATQRYIESLRIAPQHPKALLSLALLGQSLGDGEAAARHLELALKYHANNPQVHYTAGRIYLNQGNLLRAEYHLRTALALRQDFPEAKRLLAQVYLSQEQPEATIQIIKALLDEESRQPLAWYTLGLAYAQSEGIPQAINALTQAIRLRGDDEIARIALENLALEKLPINDPVRARHAQYHLEKGRRLEERNFLDTAAFEYRRSLRLNPESKEGRLAYAGVFRLLGYPIKYQKELEVLKGLGYEDPRIVDGIEMISSELADRVSAAWKIDQYALDKDTYPLSIYHLQPYSREIHPQAGEVLAAYLTDLLQRYENIRLIPGEVQVSSFEQAFRQARGNGSDYFLLMWFEETERSFTLLLEQYLSRTGKRLKSYRVFRTGNHRIRDSFMVAGFGVQAALSLKGKILAREFNRGIIDLGSLDGLSADDRLIIVKKGALGLSSDQVGLRVKEDDILGDFTVTRLDERIAEGTVGKRSFFDFINPGDHVIRPLPEEVEPEEKSADQEEGGLLRRLFALVGF